MHHIRMLLPLLGYLLVGLKRLVFRQLYSGRGNKGADGMSENNAVLILEELRNHMLLQLRLKNEINYLK